MNKKEIEKQLIQMSVFTTNAAAKEILTNAIKFINKK